MGTEMESEIKLYCRAEGEEEFKEMQFIPEPNPEFVDFMEAGIIMDDLKKSTEICIEITSELGKKIRAILGYISQKRFRKLLYSIGYGRNEVNKIIKETWNFKGSYNISDVEYWRGKTRNGNKNNN